ncbi:TPR repeat protein [Trichormus variabilis ATCC 29413]|uniref:TPR repeat protein n=2 Tax=Anabaena variabilis TaxID=264691 RepID=Q3M7G7_TRIV2|nr:MULTISPECIES: tetratricopeptide repeat protein [Nostocaceae]ABA23069.1 TPR repeat protein [Trichormus variabilis ATCC 29413]MBC1216068.1 tetratricopeptide repeat protein [Trichormus variabilis ARAD]MBC1255904.1 tetratricopeptide repeat protein [Trichormus variabilis V5]MBC1265692.1 tetratricopeptide repeat protein [Trichormus variabilis FSR]MBC1303445.1 tetratricopeptide repeat protein [Trichormus variabilis N2B]
MDAEAALAWLDTIIPAQTGERLSDLQKVIVVQVWLGRKYLDIARAYGCTEGHAKDAGSHLWKLLSQVLRQRITKSNCRATLERVLRKTTAISGLIDYPKVTQQPTPKLEDSNFLGREGAIAHLNTLVNQGSKVIVIQGEGGLGKTTLAQQYLQTQGFELVLELLMAKETQNITPAERVVEEWLKQDFGEEPGVEFGVTLGRLKRQLHNRRIGVLIDNLEPALDQQGGLIPLHGNYVELLRVLADVRVQSVTLITSRDRLCEPGLNVHHYRLPGLDQSAWQKFFSSCGLTINLPTLQQIHRTYGGNAKAMGILCGAILEDFGGDMALYWQEHHGDPLAATDLKNLAVSQINRLQALDPQAYRLLCRLGCYRYQDIPSIPSPGVFCLLWDVPASEHRQLIASLRNRSLVECHQGKYWLHPVIRAEAIARLRTSDEWEITNHKVAEFWTASVSRITIFQDALQALEAYYHYIEINEFESAGKVILKSRNNQWQQFLPLGSTLYRMGLIQPIMTAINQVVKNIGHDQDLSELYNILGDLYWITGDIIQAIACQEKTIDLTTQALKSLVPQPGNKHKVYYLRMLEVDSLLSIGLYKIDLWELEEAAKLFQQVIYLAQNTDHHRWAEKASVCLALVNSYLGLYDAAYLLADVAYQNIKNEEILETGRFAYFMQILGQTYVNLGEFTKAKEMFHQALTFAEESHYMQVKAKTLNGLAEIHRQQADYPLALAYHTEAIELLEKIGAKCDLAETYFQLGLTYQKMAKSDASQKYFAQATHLFTEIKAPNQVAKISITASF